MKLPRRDRLANSAIRRSGITVLAWSAVLVGSGCIAFPRVAIVPPVRGQVVSAADQAPLPEALVTARWSRTTEVLGHGGTRTLGSDYQFADKNGRFRFPRKVLCFLNYAGLRPYPRTTLNEVGLAVYAGPLYRALVVSRSPTGERVLTVAPDEMQTGAVTWPLTPRNVAKRYLAIYEGYAHMANRLLNEPQAARHPQYRQLLEYRDAMERKAAEWRERLEQAADEPVLDRPPPP